MENEISMAANISWRLVPSAGCKLELVKEIADTGLARGPYYNTIDDALQDVRVLLKHKPQLFKLHQEIHVVQTIVVFNENI